VNESSPLALRRIPNVVRAAVLGLKGVICEPNVSNSAPFYSASPPSCSFWVKRARILSVIDQSFAIDALAAAEPAPND
jgi:hypothetical protein